MCYSHEPRSTHIEMRVLFKDNLYYIYMVCIYDDTGECVPYAKPITTPKASIEELQLHLNKMLDCTNLPVINYPETLP